jgi:hypothetical protein
MNEKDKKIWSEAAKATASLGDSWDAQVAFLQKFADLVRADEREACAKYADTLQLDLVAADIRARGQA